MLGVIAVIGIAITFYLLRSIKVNIWAISSIFAGVVLIFLQVLSFFGNIDSGQGVFSGHGVLLYDLVYCGAYYFVGICGCIFIFVGFFSKDKKEDC